MIYPQSITGRFRKTKDYAMVALLLIYFCCSWMRWDRGANIPNQAIMLDLPNRKAYLFAIEIWPDEAYYITGILILAALGLFFVTSLFGRIWCGYACPNTVFVDLFMKVETYFQGDRNARMKLDSEPMTNEKFKKKLYTHLCWLLIGFSFAFGWVCYFYDAPTLVKDIFHFKVSAGGLGWLLGLTFSTYLFAGWVREKVCIYMCPYGRFQSAMLDNDSSLVTYHKWRGEPRGKEKDAGDCIDCGKCVVVCPMGIDIRDGLQMACIGCGLCVDACNTVMPKLNRPLDLIAYDSTNSSKAKMEGSKLLKNYLSPKTFIFAAVFLVVSILIFTTLLNKPSFRFDVLRDRETLFTILPDGTVRNSYTLKLGNRTHEDEHLIIKVTGLEKALIKSQGEHENYRENVELTLSAESETSIKVFIKTEQNQSIKEKDIAFEITNDKNRIMYTKYTIFYYR